jgi:hypothetical protein
MSGEKKGQSLDDSGTSKKQSQVANASGEFQFEFRRFSSPIGTDRISNELRSQHKQGPQVEKDGDKKRIKAVGAHTSFIAFSPSG